MINIHNLEFKKLDLSGTKILLQWAFEEGWNSGHYDAEAFYGADPDGFYGFFNGEEMIAGGAIVSYNGEFGFMGLFIVKPAFRGQGIGRKLWYKRRDTLFSRLKKGAIIGMDGVVAMQPFYNKGGFEFAYTNGRFERKGESFEIDKNISSIDDVDFEIIAKYDKECFGFDRSIFLKNWLKLPESKSFKFVENGKFKGFAKIRKVNVGYKICPLFADNEIVAEKLYKACLNGANGELVFLDSPMIHKAAQKMIKKFGAKYVFECGRMYYGTPPKIPIEKIFGVTTFELG